MLEAFLLRTKSESEEDRSIEDRESVRDAADGLLDWRLARSQGVGEESRGSSEVPRSILGEPRGEPKPGAESMRPS